MENGLVAQSCKKMRRPKVDDTRERRLYQRIRLYGVSPDECPPTEFEWLCRATKSKELPTIILVASETGMRRTEVSMLERERINLTQGIVRLSETKNGKPRNVVLTPFATEALRAWIGRTPIKGRIFTMQPESVSKAFARARSKARTMYEDLCKKYGRRPHPAYFNNLRFHDLRHEGVSQLAGIYLPQEVAKISGQSLKTMMRYYHPDDLYLAKKMARSPLAKKQREQLRYRLKSVA